MNASLSLNELRIGHQDSSPSNGHWNYMPYFTKKKEIAFQQLTLFMLGPNNSRQNRAVSCCWCPGSLCRWIINSHDIDFVRQVGHVCHEVNFQLPVPIHSLIARFMGPTWGPSGADRTEVGPMLAPWILLSGTMKEWYKMQILVYICSN